MTRWPFPIGSLLRRLAPTGAVTPVGAVAPPRIVEPHGPSLWRDRGWVSEPGVHGDIYRGEFHAYHAASSHGTPRAFAGCIVSLPGGACQVYIFNPPAALRHDCGGQKHSKAACFHRYHNVPFCRHPGCSHDPCNATGQHRGIRARWWRMAWYRPAPDVDRALLYVEMLLGEALLLSGARAGRPAREVP